MAIPVRDPDFWNAKDISLALREALNFVTEDGWEFHFEKLVEPGAGQMRLIETDAELHGQPAASYCSRAVQTAVPPYEFKSS